MNHEGWGREQGLSKSPGGQADGAASGFLDDGEVSLCSMTMGSELFGIDTGKVREVLGRSTVRSVAEAMGGTTPATHGMGSAPANLRPVPLAPSYIAGVIPYRGEVLTTLSLRALLGRKDPGTGGCVMVLDDKETGELLGLMVDNVGRVVTVKEAMLEANPRTLDARSRALFAGAYKMTGSLIVRIDPARLHPSRLAATGIFGAVSGGGPSCAR